MFIIVEYLAEQDCVFVIFLCNVMLDFLITFLLLSALTLTINGK